MKHREGDTDARLACRAKHGDQAAFAELAGRCQKAIRATADEFARFHRGASGILDADELFQIGLVSLWSKIVPGYRLGKGALFVTYLCSSLRNIFMDQVRSAARQKRQPPPLRDLFYGRKLLGIQVMVADHDSHRALVENEHEASLALLRTLLGLMPERSRAMVVMRFGLCDGTPVSAAKVAKRFGLCRTGASLAISRALVKAREKYESGIQAAV